MHVIPLLLQCGSCVISCSRYLFWGNHNSSQMIANIYWFDPFAKHVYVPYAECSLTVMHLVGIRSKI